MPGYPFVLDFEFIWRTLRSELKVVLEVIQAYKMLCKEVRFSALWFTTNIRRYIQEDEQRLRRCV